MRERIDRPSFFIFSDDIEWARTHLNISGEVYFVAGNHGEESCRDMHPMSLCSAHVIAKGSFSWWGAWLSSSDDKLVVAPKRWFSSERIDTNDLIPAPWLGR